MPKHRKPEADAGPGDDAPWEKRLFAIYRHRKELKLTEAALTVLSLLVIQSWDKTLIRFHCEDYAIKIGFNYRTMRDIIQRLREIDCIRLTAFKGSQYLIVDPLLANRGNPKYRALKIKLWEQAISYKRIHEIDSIIADERYFIEKSHS